MTELETKLLGALKEMASIVEIHSEATSNNFAWAELDAAHEAIDSADAAQPDEVQRAVEAEREACAKVCEDHAMALDHRGNVYIRTWDCKKAAAAIRARANKH